MQMVSVAGAASSRSYMYPTQQLLAPFQISPGRDRVNGKRTDLLLCMKPMDNDSHPSPTPSCSLRLLHQGAIWPRGRSITSFSRVRSHAWVRIGYLVPGWEGPTFTCQACLRRCQPRAGYTSHAVTGARARGAAGDLPHAPFYWNPRRNAQPGIGPYQLSWSR